MKKILFCLPGKSYSGKFLECWTNLIAHCMASGHHFGIVQKYSCNIYYVRNLCLGGNVMLGENQVPFNGQVDYDYIMWIDSDIIFTVDQFQRLLDRELDIVSGLYLMDNGTQFATVENWDEELFQKQGSFEFLTPNSITGSTELKSVAYTGFGFMCVKRGVFESMKYPWFRPEFVQIGDCKDFTMEDVSWCRTATKLGYKILVDPTVVVGHEKTKVLV